MRIALLSDIHGNREALTACLEHASAGGADRFVFLGDYVGYGADPGFVVDTVAAHTADGAIAIRGNHDEAIEVGTKWDFMDGKIGARAALFREEKYNARVPNAAIQLNANVDEMTLQQWQDVIDVNLTGMFLCARESVRAFKRQGIDRSISYAGGKLIFMSSVHDVIPWAGHANYAAAKGGLMLLMKSLAQEVSHLRIRVNAISPGVIATPFHEVFSTPETIANFVKGIPLGRVGKSIECATVIAFLVSDAASYIAGETVEVNGGQMMR